MGVPGVRRGGISTGGLTCTDSGRLFVRLGCNVSRGPWFFVIPQLGKIISIGQLIGAVNATRRSTHAIHRTRALFLWKGLGVSSTKSQSPPAGKHPGWVGGWG